MIRLISFVKSFLLSMLIAYLLSLIISQLPLKKDSSSLLPKRSIREKWTKFFSDKVKPLPVMKEKKATAKPAVTRCKQRTTRKRIVVRTLIATLRPVMQTMFGAKVRPTTKKEGTSTSSTTTTKTTRVATTTKTKTTKAPPPPTTTSSTTTTTKAPTAKKATTTLKTRKLSAPTTTPKVANTTNKRTKLKLNSKSINITANHKSIKSQSFSTTLKPKTTKAHNKRTMVNKTTQIHCKNLLSLKLNISKVTDLNRKEINTYKTNRCDVKDGVNCKQDQLVGPLPVNTTIVDLKELYETELGFVQFGGWWTPKNCTEIAKTAILIPFRNRHQHLPVFLRHLHPLLQRQNLHYRIFLIEQNDTNGFNRAKLFNVGYREALKLFPYDCFVFHDIDLIPENDKINYGCEKSPMHLSVAIDKFNYQLPYDSIFGGVGMIRPAHFEKVNGFSNIFYSWGGEDDVMSSRLRGNGFKLNRQSAQIARYKMLRHNSKGRSRDDVALTSRVMGTSLNNQHDDGLNSLQYRVNRIIQKQLYTMIKVDLQKEKEKTFGIKIR